MTHDPIQTAFASLRADEAPRLAAPGAAAAHRTVRRRRRLAAGAAAGVTTMLLLGAGYLTSVGGGLGLTGDPGPATVAADGAGQGRVTADGAEPTRPPAEPEGSPGGMGELSAATAAALGLDGTSLGTVFEVSRSEEPDLSLAVLTMADRAADSGTFRLRVGCGGAGTMTLTLRAASEEGVTVTARCGATTQEIADGAGEATVTFAADDEFVEVSLERDPAAREADSTIAVNLIPA